MAGFFGNGRGKGSFSVRERMESKYSSARMNLFIVVAFTVINIVMCLFDAESYFLFSAFVPYYMVLTGMVLCGKYPAEFYEDLGPVEFIDSSFLIIMIIIAAILVLLYLLCAIMCGKRKIGWLVAALVLFSLDTICLFMLAGVSIDMIVDYVFHAWVIWSLASGVYAHYKLKNMPAEDLVVDETFPEGAQDESSTGEQYVADSSYIRYADNEVKAKVLLEAEFGGHKVCYRRVKRVNELVIDGKVYDELEAVIEPPHVLGATVDGHFVEAGLTSASQSFINVDGATVAKKIRLV